MKKDYNIYAGLGGSFGGYSYIGTLQNASEDEAYQYAFEEACNIYDSYAGYNGIRSIDDIMDEEGVDENEAVETYIEERESWLDYYAVPIEEDTELEEEIFYL